MLTNVIVSHKKQYMRPVGEEGAWHTSLYLQLWLILGQYLGACYNFINKDYEIPYVFYRVMNLFIISNNKNQHNFRVP